jgi:hypothetical protein
MIGGGAFMPILGSTMIANLPGILYNHQATLTIL